MANTLERLEKALLGVGVVGREEGAMDPLVAEALKAQSPAPVPAPAPVSVAAKPTAPAPAVPAPQVETSGNASFYDMLLANDSYRLANREAFERNERANRARTHIAAVADALSSLGNLVGTTYGAESQEQTYQTPLVNAQREEDLARARRLAQSIQDEDAGLRTLRMKLDSANDKYGSQLAVQDAITQRALANAQARAALEADKHGYRTAENEQKAGFTSAQHDVDNASRERIAAGRNATSSSNKDKDISFKRDELEAKKNGEIGSGGGGVAGYTTETTIQRDKYGRETGRTTTRTGSNGQTTTRTTGSASPGGPSQGNSGKKPNPMGAPAQQGAKKKKKNPMN